MTMSNVKMWLRAVWFTFRTGYPMAVAPEPPETANDLPDGVIGEPVDDRTETAAQALHAFRHLAGSAHVCGQCRAYARIAVGAYNRNR